jgi:hypothetical protein
MQDLIIQCLKTKGPGSTRQICNRIFLKNNPLIPDKNKMKKTYYYLRKLEKAGIVKLDYPGYYYLKSIPC